MKDYITNKDNTQTETKIPCLLKTTYIVKKEVEEETFKSVTVDPNTVRQHLPDLGEINLQDSDDGNISIPEKIFEFGEEGTFQKLKHMFKNKILHGRSLVEQGKPRAMRNFYQYMRWNAEHRCVLCKSHFTSFADFLRHCFEEKPCSKQMRKGQTYFCPPCKLQFDEPRKFMMHMIKEDYHGSNVVSKIPKVDSSTYKKLFETFKMNGKSTICTKRWILYNDIKIAVVFRFR